MSLAAILSHWYYNFADLQLSANEFYTTLESRLKDKGYPNITMKRVTHSEGGMFSSGREYLQITRREYVFDICAAPFGKSFFISWWLGESGSFLAGLLAKIPVIGNALARRVQQKTYYQIDTEVMFKESIRQCILSVIDEVLESKGMRALNDQERLAQDKVRA